MEIIDSIMPASFVEKHKHDKEKECEICSKPFVMIHRPRRHCKNCQMTICKSCSHHKLQIHDGKDEERVCDICFSQLGGSSSSGTDSSSRRLSDLLSTGILVNPSLNPASTLLSILKKRWLRSRHKEKYKEKQEMLFKGLTVIKAGSMWINIMNAVNIPKCDGPTGKPDAYCKYWVTTNDNLRAHVIKHKTKIKKNTFKPKWNEQRSITITNTTGTLMIELWDYDAASKDDYLGKVEIALHSLSARQRSDGVVDGWFDIELAEKYQTSKSVSLESNQKESVRKSECRIHLQIKLIVSYYGNLMSYFDPVIKPVQITKFKLDKSIAELNIFLKDFWIFMDVINENMSILKWIQYEWSIYYVVLFGTMVWNPWFISFYIYLRLLVYVCHSYVRLNVKRQAQINLSPILHSICTIFGNLPMILLLIRVVAKYNQKKDMLVTQNEEVLDMDADDLKDGKIDDEELLDALSDGENDISMSAFTKFAGSKVIKVSGMKSTLQTIQETLIMLNDGSEYLKAVCNWQDEHAATAKMIVYGLLALCLMSVTFKDMHIFQYQVYFIGMFILTFYSKPVTWTIWILSGTASWYSNKSKYNIPKAAHACMSESLTPESENGINKIVLT